MDSNLLWGVTPYLLFHVYRERINAFLLQEEIYDEWALFAVEEGEFRYELNNMTYTAMKGDIILCPPGKIFKREVMTALSFHFIRLIWKDTSGITVTNGELIPTGKIELFNMKRLNSTYSLLKSLAGLYTLQALEWKNHLLKDLWYLYLAQESLNLNPTYKILDDPMMNTAIQYIHENAYKSCSIKNLTALLGVSSVQLTRKFKAALGVIPSDYITSLRLEKVKKLLVNSNMTHAQIAAHCGYENEFYMSRIFTIKVGINPSSYRKHHKI